MIDDAFKSRIHISLHYPPLDWEGTCMIWRNNIARVRARALQSDLVVDEKDLLQYAEELYSRQKEMEGTTWNGREIRNAFQSALALAEFKLGPGSTVRLTRDHLENIYQSYKDFNNNLRQHIVPSDTDITTALNKDKLSGKLPKLWEGLEPRNIGQLSGSSSGSSTISDSDDRPRFPPWQSYQPQSINLPAAPPADQNQQFPHQVQYQGWPQLQGGPFLPSPLAFYAAGTYGTPHMSSFQAMRQPQFPYPNTLVSSPGGYPTSPGSYPPPAMGPGQAARGVHPMYGPSQIPNSVQSSVTTNEAFDWLGERGNNQSEASGGGPGTSMWYDAVGKSEHKHKRR